MHSFAKRLWICEYWLGISFIVVSDEMTEHEVRTYTWFYTDQHIAYYQVIDRRLSV